MRDFKAYDELVESKADGYIQELMTLCRQESVSSTGEGIGAMAEQIVETLIAFGLPAEVLNPGEAYPVVLGTVGQGARTLLLYDHYDTVPPGAPEAWTTPPFEPEIRGGKLYGRGTGDDKGELMARLQALSAYRQVFGELPIQVKFIIEGAHEIGSPGLAQVVQANRSRLQAEACVSEGLGRDTAGNFALYLGCRGFAYIELSVSLRSYALASMYGGVLANPADRLLRAIASLTDESGNLTVDGWQDWVPQPTAADLAALELIPFDEAGLRSQLGAKEFIGGLSGAKLLRRYLFDPFTTICSITSGNAADGLALPGTATARLDFRLVPDLEPATMADLIRGHLAARGFGEVEVRLLAGVPPDRCPLDAPIVADAIAAARDLTGKDPILYPIMPAYSASRVFHQNLGTPVIFAGAVTNDESNLHGPDENIRLADYVDYLKYFGRLISRLG